jgi:putative phosphoesterase
MKKLLLLGDIHANYPALKTILRHIDPDHFDWIINTGDFTVYGTFPNETIQWFRERNNSICILGNTDRRILRILKGKKLKRPKKEEKRVMYYWTSQNLHPENASYLESLSKQTDITLDHIHIGIFHGTFDDPDEELFPFSPESRFYQLSKDSPYRIHIMGHSHVPYYKIVNGVHFINPGSVGRMFDGDPRASYAILTLSSGKISVKHFRTPYPVEEAVNSLKENQLPDIYATMLRTGKKLN